MGIKVVEYSNNIIIYSDIEVSSRLGDFGLSRDDAVRICEGGLYGMSLSSGLQPKTAEGQLKYIFGVEALRLTFELADGIKYENFSKGNIEGVFDPVNCRKIMFQMVERACGAEDPQPKSKIGNGKKRLIQKSRSTFLFPEWEKEERRREERVSALDDAECWYFIMSIDDNNVVCCELSRPKSVDEEKFDGFYERILIFKHGKFKLSDKDHHSKNDNIFEIKPIIKKK